MTGAFLFLTLCSFKNRLVSMVRRLKQPRYLLFAVLGGGYFYAMAGRHWMSGARLASRGNLPALPPVLLEVAAAILILGSIVVALCGAPPVSPIAFTEAEVQHLFTAPVSRRSLIRWKLMKGQVGVLFSALIFTLFSGPYLARGGRPSFFAGIWIAFATMQFYLIGIRMALHGLKRRGVGWGRRVAVALPVTGVAVTAAALWSWNKIGPPPAEMASGGETLAAFGRYVEALAGSGPAWILLYPGRLLVRPALASGLTAFMLDLAPACILLLLGYFWVMRAGVALEEGAIEAARRLAEARMFVGGRFHRPGHIHVTPPPFKLSPTGRPETALLWKNLIAAFRNIGGFKRLAWMIGVPFVLLVLALKVTRTEAASAVVGSLCGMFAGVLLVVGPSILHIDFRQDLARMDLLRSYPLRGKNLLVGTLLAPVLLLTAIEWMLLAAFAILAGGVAGESSSWGPAPAVIALTGAILAIPMTWVASLVHNAALLLMPAWVSLGPSRTSGVERIGQGLFTAMGLVLVMALSLVPAALIFAVSWLICSSFIGGAASVPVSALPAAAALAMECWLGVELLGGYLDRFDPSRELDSLTHST